MEERGMGNERREGRRVGSGKNGKKWGWGRGEIGRSASPRKDINKSFHFPE